jgi:hypothetical protein
LGLVCILAAAVSSAFFDDNGGSGVGWCRMDWLCIASAQFNQYSFDAIFFILISKCLALAAVSTEWATLSPIC